MDALLHSRAVAAGKATKGVGNAGGTARRVRVAHARGADRALEGNLDDLEEDPAGGSGPSPKIEELVQAYLSGDPAKLDTDLFGPMRKGSALQKRLLHDLLDDRNVRLATRMDAGLREDSKRSCSMRSARDT